MELFSLLKYDLNDHYSPQSDGKESSIQVQSSGKHLENDTTSAGTRWELQTGTQLWIRKDAHTNSEQNCFPFIPRG